MKTTMKMISQYLPHLCLTLVNLISYDPNYCYDDDEMGDIDGDSNNTIYNVDDDYGDVDYYYDDDDDDCDDDSWKIRRASLKVIKAITRATTPRKMKDVITDRDFVMMLVGDDVFIECNLATIGKPLARRCCVEREDIVRTDALEAYELLFSSSTTMMSTLIANRGSTATTTTTTTTMYNLYRGHACTDRRLGEYYPCGGDTSSDTVGIINVSPQVINAPPPLDDDDGITTQQQQQADGNVPSSTSPPPAKRTKYHQQQGKEGEDVDE
ncbi:hypothetical protein FOL46_000731, partial [Perkinsus olseni]